MGSHGIGLHLYLDGMDNPEIDWSIEYVSTYRPRWMNVTAFSRHDQAMGVIERIRRASPTTRTIWRGGPREVFPDERLWELVSPEAWFRIRVEPYIDWLRSTQTAVLTSNEMGWSVDWALKEADAAVRAHMVGVSAAVMRTSTGSPGNGEGGSSDDYAKMAEALRLISQTRAVISPNEYTANVPQFRSGHVARYMNYWRIQDQLRVPRSEIVIGEYAPVKFINYHPQADDGWQNDGISLERYFQIMEEDNGWYLPNGVSRLMYCVGRWRNGSFGLDKRFSTGLSGRNFTLGTVVQPPPQPPSFEATDKFQWAAAIVPAGTRVNVRALPSTQSRSGVIGYVTNDMRCLVMKPPTEPLNWYVVRLPDLRIGYIRSDVISWRKA